MHENSKSRQRLNQRTSVAHNGIRKNIYFQPTSTSESKNKNYHNKTKINQELKEDSLISKNNSTPKQYSYPYGEGQVSRAYIDILIEQSFKSRHNELLLCSLFRRWKDFVKTKIHHFSFEKTQTRANDYRKSKSGQSGSDSEDNHHKQKTNRFGFYINIQKSPTHPYDLYERLSPSKKLSEYDEKAENYKSSSNSSYASSDMTFSSTQAEDKTIHQKYSNHSFHESGPSYNESLEQNVGSNIPSTQSNETFPKKDINQMINHIPILHVPRISQRNDDNDYQSFKINSSKQSDEGNWKNALTSMGISLNNSLTTQNKKPETPLSPGSPQSKAHPKKLIFRKPTKKHKKVSTGTQSTLFEGSIISKKSSNSQNSFKEEGLQCNILKNEKDSDELNSDSDNQFQHYCDKPSRYYSQEINGETFVSSDEFSPSTSETENNKENKQEEEKKIITKNIIKNIYSFDTYENEEDSFISSDILDQIPIRAIKGKSQTSHPTPKIELSFDCISSTDSSEAIEFLLK